MDDLIEQLEWRGFVAQMTDPDLGRHFSAEPRALYAGFDPSAASLHVGHMVPVMALAHAQRSGHKPIILIGGGTGLIGDPSGKSNERPLLSREDVERNCCGIRAQLSSFMDVAGAGAAIVVNNAEWLEPLRLLEFLRDVGKYFTVNSMIAREAVRRRLEDRDQGISYTEFSYSLLQSYDFLHLFEHYGCTVQAGGNDQWGNIVSGIDLIGRVCHRQAYGLTFPLLLTSSGAKFGKTEAGAIWLDPELTSPYQMYQFWLNTADTDVARFLRLFTFLDRVAIEEISSDVAAHPEGRNGQRVLAREFTTLVHGKEVVQSVEKACQILFGARDIAVDSSTLAQLVREIPHSELQLGPDGTGVALTDALVSAGLTESRAAARKLIAGGGVYVNNERWTEASARLTEANLLYETAILLRSGKKKHHLAMLRK